MPELPDVPNRWSRSDLVYQEQGSRRFVTRQAQFCCQRTGRLDAIEYTHAQEPDVTVILSLKEWRSMGEPLEITVTVAPGYQIVNRNEMY